MKRKAKVIEIKDGGRAVVECEREEMCAGCHSKGSCPTPCRIVRSEAINRIGAKLGDTVEIETSDGSVLFYAFGVFLIPTFLAISAYFLTKGSEALRIAVTSVTALVSFIGFAFYMNRRAKKEFTSEIVSVVDVVIKESENIDHEQKKTMERNNNQG